VWPPIYYLQGRETGEAGPNVVTGYLLAQCMEQRISQHVTIRDAVGDQQVDVRPLSN
jgi:hypothetical protein